MRSRRSWRSISEVGVRQVWVVYPRQSKVYAYTSTTKVRVLAPGDELDGGDVCQAFACR